MSHTPEHPAPTPEESRPVTVPVLREAKRAGRRITMLTAYDHPTARLLDQAGVDVLLVGDSVANNVLGYSSTLPVTMEEMLHHTRAVVRGVRRALVVADMPYLSYQTSRRDAIRNAGRFLKEAGAAAVKLEGGSKRATLVRSLVDAEIPVMGHIGLTPQSVHVMGGYHVQGRRADEATRLIEDARALQEAGAFLLILEGIPEPVGRAITEAVVIPTVGIGAGRFCDGQVLVLHDLIGLNQGPLPRFARRYADVSGIISEAAARYVDDVHRGTFPSEGETYGTPRPVAPKTGAGGS